MMRKHKLKTSVFAVASTGLLLLSVASFNAEAGAPIEPDEEASNFLSVPAIFAEGYGITGLEIVGDHNSGLPEGSDPETWLIPYCFEGTEYYLQAEPTNSWQADWTVASGEVSVTVDWSDEVIKKEWNDKSVIPVSVTLYRGIEPGSMNGYEMTPLPANLLPSVCSDGVADTSVFSTSEEESEEIDLLWGTTPDSYGAYYDRATVFTVGAKLTIGELVRDADGNYVPVKDADGNEVYIFSSPVTMSFENLGKPDWLSPAIDVEGRIIYLYNWNLAAKQFGPEENRSGWYRLTFSIVDPVSYTLSKGYSVEDRGTYNVDTKVTFADEVDESNTGEDVVYEPTVHTAKATYVDIEITHLDTGE